MAQSSEPSIDLWDNPFYPPVFAYTCEMSQSMKIVGFLLVFRLKKIGM